MAKFNIVLTLSTVDEDRTHAACFLEIAKLLQLALHDLGHTVVFEDTLCKDGVNIILGYQFLNGQRLPPGYEYIIYQLEQLSETEGWPLHILETLRTDCTVWDFSQRNIDFLAERGIHAVHKPLGFHRDMLKIHHAQKKNIDVLFYGSKNRRRIKIFKELRERFNLKVLYGVYGAERDAWIARAKIVLSIHYYEVKDFDDVRMSYLLNNKVFTIVEDTPHKKYEDFVLYVEYDGIVDACEYYLENHMLRKQIALKAHNKFAQYPETEFLARALAHSHQNVL